MLRSLTFERFRGFERFSLHDLGRVNLLVGMNNCGKTTVLEGLQLLSAPGDLSTLVEIHRRRGEDLWRHTKHDRSPYAEIRRLFHGHDIQEGAAFEIKASEESGRKSVRAEILPLTELTSRERSLFDSPPENGELENRLAPLCLRMCWNADETSTIAVELTHGGDLSYDQVRRVRRRTQDMGPARLITTASLNAEAVVHLFESMVLTTEEDLVLEALRIIDPSIERLAIGSSESLRYGPGGRGGIVVRCTGTPERIPIGSLGDGIWRILGIALALVGAQKGILLVDEIDTGLHFTVLEKVWRLVYETAKRLNVQVFATTHSRDCFESLASICQESVSEGSDITIQRIERNRSTSIAYSEQEIIAAAARGMEVR